MIYVVVFKTEQFIYKFLVTQTANLTWDEILMKVFPTYYHYTNIILCDLKRELCKNSGNNKYAIELIKNKSL